MRIAIAGAGVAGLTSALALARRGFSVEIFERAEALEEIGAGIQLSPNAMSVLQHLDVADSLLPHAVEPRAIEVRDAPTGMLVATVPLGETARRRYGAPYLLIHRADLQGALLAAARRHEAISLRLRADVHEVRATENGVTFRAGGQIFRADVLVAADGIGSQLRLGHFGYSGPRPLGATAWRAALPTESVPTSIARDATGLWMGPGGHLVHYPLKAGAILNVVVIAKSTGASSPPRAPFGPDALRLIEAVSDWRPWPLFDVDPTLPFARGRITLIGDAAHAMAPTAAQGGAQSIEDAWVLAAALAADPKQPISALEAYASVRRRRVGRVSREARRNLSIYEMKSAARVARNLLLRALPTNVLLTRLDWLFKWQAGEKTPLRPERPTP